ncbi:amino acid/amide ABC transporter substrate-binding protein, HAAT family [Rhizobiales bacterium GAS191]|nr:amino acid/amide ABC transporter substrate-binding protein, HAAT family [Rhizobiales bacterium GAS113]SEB97954.1 amino acid/amide ABC transporter substrate-binding protein, HAAT family [Rhizobiales bacterium GAS191]SED20424.1 amino acid/amide ABC transporter substrate-binding protein, HAAT family [Rhizobiales bacterium GAS188]
MRRWIGASALALLGLSVVPVMAQEAIKIVDVAELSGGGATVGTNFKNGADLAADEINAKGGILGHKLEITHYDTQSNAGVARGLVQKAIDSEPYAIFGPGYSGSVKAVAPLFQQAGITDIMGGEAAELTKFGNAFIFRTSFGQQSSMPKVARYLHDEVKAQTVAVEWVNNDFGKGGRDEIIKALGGLGVKIVADVSSEQGQADFSSDVAKIKAANPDAVFVYVNEDESARFLKEAQKQALGKPLIGETTLLGQKVIDLAGAAADGVRGHIGLTTDAPVPAVQEFRKRFEARYHYVPDHNGIKGYLAPYMVKAATEKMGKLDREHLADALHGLTITPEKEPGILMEATWDKNGDIDRQSFLAEVEGGKQKIIKILPKLGK